MGEKELLTRPLHRRVHSAPAELAEVRKLVAEMAAATGFAAETAGRIVLAIDEALANCIKHGYAGEPGHPIDLTATRIERSGRVGLEFVIRDFGRQVDPETIRSRDLADVRPGGLGVHIIETIMDEMEYSCPADGGMRLRVCKFV